MTATSQLLRNALLSKSFVRAMLTRLPFSSFLCFLKTSSVKPRSRSASRTLLSAPVSHIACWCIERRVRHPVTRRYPSNSVRRLLWRAGHIVATKNIWFVQRTLGQLNTGTLCQCLAPERDVFSINKEHPAPEMRIYGVGRLEYAFFLKRQG